MTIMVIMMAIMFVSLAFLGVVAAANHVRVAEMKRTLAKKNVVVNELVHERSFGDRVNRRLEDQINTISQQVSLLAQQVNMLTHENETLRTKFEASERRIGILEETIRGYDETRKRESERSDGLRLVK